jgi:hypothetical protein
MAKPGDGGAGRQGRPDFADGVFALIAYGLLVVAALLLPETKGGC